MCWDTMAVPECHGSFSENQKYTHKKKKYGNKEIVIYSQKNKLNEKRFYIHTKISINVKIRNKKKFTKNSLGEAIFRGGGVIFQWGNFLGKKAVFLASKCSWGAIFWGSIFQGGTFPGSIFPRTVEINS